VADSRENRFQFLNAGVGCDHSHDRILPQIERLLGRIDAVAGRAMQVQDHVHAMLLSKLHGSIELLQHRFVQLAPLLRLAPAVVGHRKPHEIEAPPGQPFEVFFPKWLLISGSEFLGEIETAPAKQL
jgi:hypothetical protein